jgi:zinc/manganese transport system substrate-binding protein
MGRNGTTRGDTGSGTRRGRRIRKPLIVCAVASVFLAGLGSRPAGVTFASSSHASAPRVRIVVAENFWGSIVQQEAGSHATVTSIITNPNTDPHAYEPTTTDARLMAQAQYVVFNGAGYDPWVQKLLAANPVNHRAELNVSSLIGKKVGDNPHMWYSPGYVTRVANQVTADLKRLDPRDASSYTQLHNRFVHTALKGYFGEINLIARKYHGVSVGATESIFVYLASALHLNLITPPGFMKALSEGTGPTAQDRATFDDQITHKKIKVFVFNIQNSTPDTTALESKARAEHIPVVAITETLQPASASFQVWQTRQLTALASALAKATGH